MRTVLLLVYVSLFAFKGSSLCFANINNISFAYSIIQQQSTSESDVVPVSLFNQHQNSSKPAPNTEFLYICDDAEEEDLHNNFVAGKYLIPSVTDFHFVKYYHTHPDKDNNTSSAFNFHPIYCLYLLQQVFRI